MEGEVSLVRSKWDLPEVREGPITWPDSTKKDIIRLVSDGLTSEHSRRAYSTAIGEFLDWYREQGSPGLNRATVQHYKVELEARGLAPSTVNLKLSAIRKLAREAANNALLSPEIGEGIARVKGVRTAGIRMGNWLSKRQAQKLLKTPDISTLKGLRDRAILAIHLGGGLRRSEIAELTFAHIQQREGRWVIVDLVGKGNRTRTVPIPSWTKAAIDAWRDAAGLDGEGYVFRSMRKGDQLLGESMTPEAIRNVVTTHTRKLGLDCIAPHDLRRTWAKLAYSGGSPLDQIQLSLGHASIKTTEDYLGVQQDLTDAPCDRLGLRL